jgi:hypothetical protein
VSKHTTCNDVDEGGVKRLVEVLGCRCHHRDVDVGAVLLGTNKARKNQNPNTHVNAQKFGAKRTHKSCQNDVKRGNMFLNGVNECTRKYTGFSRFDCRLFPVLMSWRGRKLRAVVRWGVVRPRRGCRCMVGRRRRAGPVALWTRWH